MLKHYLGINVGAHDSSVCHLTIGDESVDATVFEEERFSREKHKGLFPFASIARLTNEVDVATIPWEHVGATSFLENLPKSFSIVEKKIFFNEFVEAKNCGLLTSRNARLRQVTHHEAHLFSVLPQVGEDSALIVVADGCGSPMTWASENAILPFPAGCRLAGHENVSVYLKRGVDLECVLKISTQQLVDGSHEAELASEVYCKAADFVFGHWFHCGKLMGLVAYHHGEVLSKEELLRVLNEDSDLPARTKAGFDALPAERLAYLARLAASAQRMFEDWFLQLFAQLKDRFPDVPNLYFTGGSALNCLLNSTVLKRQLFRKFHCIAFPNDEGVAIGAALAAAYQNGDYEVGTHFMAPSPFLGSPASLGTKEKMRALFADYSARSLDGDYSQVAHLLQAGRVVAWVFGRSECGPRALGHRSLLASAFEPGVKSLLNDRYKKRESFRPYGISVLAEDVARYFEVGPEFSSPYMSFTPTVRAEYRDLLKEVLQPDNSLRVQTVTAQECELHAVLLSFKALSGHGILVHTSLNAMGAPIVETADDVHALMQEQTVEYLVINDLLVTAGPKK